RHEPGDPRRARREQAAVAPADHPDRVAAHIVGAPRRRQRDGDRDRPRPLGEGDQRLPGRDAAEQGVLHLPAHQRGARARAGHPRSPSPDEQHDRAARRAAAQRKGRHDDHARPLRGCRARSRCWSGIGRCEHTRDGYNHGDPLRSQGARLSMKRKAYGRDRGLSLRMLLTTSMLGLLSVVFAVVLFSVLNVGFVAMLVIVLGLAIFQYFTSDKLALKASGAKGVDESEGPELHAMIARLCAMADLPKPRVAIIDTPVPNAFATGRSPRHAGVAGTTGL